MRVWVGVCVGVKKQACGCTSTTVAVAVDIQNPSDLAESNEAPALGTGTQTREYIIGK